jgi:hypothetical protein
MGKRQKGFSRNQLSARDTFGYFTNIAATNFINYA